jgi:hypothetical protein
LFTTLKSIITELNSATKTLNLDADNNLDPKPPDRKQIFPEIKKVKDEFHPENEERGPSLDNEAQKLLKNLGVHRKQTELIAGF